MKNKFKDSKGLDKAYLSLAKHYDVRKENAVRQVKEGAFVDLLNQEQSELQKAVKEKHIEKIENALPHIEAIKAMYCDIDFARYLYDHNCRIIAKDDVVLSGAEHRKLMLAMILLEQLKEDNLKLEEQVKHSRNEITEKILIKGKQLVEKWLSKDDEKVGFIFDFEEFIKKQSGVEIKEN